MFDSCNHGLCLDVGVPHQGIKHLAEDGFKLEDMASAMGRHCVSWKTQSTCHVASRTPRARPARPAPSPAPAFRMCHGAHGAKAGKPASIARVIPCKCGKFGTHAPGGKQKKSILFPGYFALDEVPFDQTSFRLTKYRSSKRRTERRYPLEHMLPPNQPKAPEMADVKMNSSHQMLTHDQSDTHDPQHTNSQAHVDPMTDVTLPRQHSELSIACSKQH